MSQAEALLNELTENIPVHDHTVVDSDTYFIIDPISRSIENTARKKNKIMQYDHKSEVFTFELPRYVEGHDMILCNVVKVHYNNIDDLTGRENADVKDVYDLHLDPEREDIVLCTWTVTREATQLAGTLNFLLQYLCEDDNGNVTYEWHTDIYMDIEVGSGRNNGPQIAIEYYDILEQWRARLFSNLPKIHTINLPLANWIESEDGTYYTQVVEMTVRSSSRVDLQPTLQQLMDIIIDGVSMFLSNDNGIVTAYSIGGIPSSDLSIQATEMVVTYA